MDALTDAAASAGDGGPWLSISELAARKGITKQSVSERVGKLVAEGRLETRPGKRNAKLVNLAEFDRAVGETGDPAKEAGAGTKAAVASDSARSEGEDSAYRGEATRAKRVEADLKELELGERLGRLVQVVDVEAAMVRCAEAIVRTVDRLPGEAKEIAAAAAKDGEHGVQLALKRIARDLRQKLKDNMTLLATGGGLDEPDDDLFGN